jgi:anti-anti-sigma regulatory factor
VAVPDLLRQVESWCVRPTAPVLVIDLAAIEVFEMSVFRSLVWARRRCLAAGRDVVLVTGDASLFLPEEEHIVRQLFRVVDRVEDAQATSAAPVA